MFSDTLLARKTKSPLAGGNRVVFKRKDSLYRCRVGPFPWRPCFFCRALARCLRFRCLRRLLRQNKKLSITIFLSSSRKHNKLIQFNSIQFNLTMSDSVVVNLVSDALFLFSIICFLAVFVLVEQLLDRLPNSKMVGHSRAPKGRMNKSCVRWLPPKSARARLSVPRKMELSLHCLPFISAKGWKGLSENPNVYCPTAACSVAVSCYVHVLPMTSLFTHSRPSFNPPIHLTGIPRRRFL